LISPTLSVEREYVVGQPEEQQVDPEVPAPVVEGEGEAEEASSAEEPSSEEQPA
jgi:hypothetical protein